MGLFKDERPQHVSKEAIAAIEAGRQIFFARFNAGFAGNKMMPGTIPGMAEQIEAVEAAGWHLDQMSWATSEKHGPEGYFLFRRA